MDERNAVRQLYADYLERAHQVERDHKPGDGLFGFGSKPSDDPCHSQFAQELEECLKKLAAEAPSSTVVREVLDSIYEAPGENRDFLSAYWMLVAVQGVTLDLIPLLAPADAEALWRRYKKMYPRWERLPAQEKVHAALKRQCGR